MFLYAETNRVRPFFFYPSPRFGSSPPSPRPRLRRFCESVRLNQAQQQIDLYGQLRENDKIIPFHLNQTGPVIRYTFWNPNEALQLRLGENDSRLEEVTHGER